MVRVPARSSAGNGEWVTAVLRHLSQISIRRISCPPLRDTAENFVPSDLAHLCWQWLHTWRVLWPPVRVLWFCSSRCRRKGGPQGPWVSLYLNGWVWHRDLALCEERARPPTWHTCFVHFPRDRSIQVGSSSGRKAWRQRRQSQWQIQRSRNGHSVRHHRHWANKQRTQAKPCPVSRGRVLRAECAQESPGMLYQDGFLLEYAVLKSVFLEDALPQWFWYTLKSMALDRIHNDRVIERVENRDV